MVLERVQLNSFGCEYPVFPEPFVEKRYVPSFYMHGNPGMCNNYLMDEKTEVEISLRTP